MTQFMRNRTDDWIDIVSKTGLPHVVRRDHPAIPIRLHLGQTQTGPGVWAQDCSWESVRWPSWIVVRAAGFLGPAGGQDEKHVSSAIQVIKMPAVEKEIRQVVPFCQSGMVYMLRGSGRARNLDTEVDPMHAFAGQNQKRAQLFLPDHIKDSESPEGRVGYYCLAGFGMISSFDTGAKGQYKQGV